MKRYVELNNEVFEVKKAKGELHPIMGVRTLTDCYSRPSEAKKNIYNYWLNWYLSVENTDYRIISMTIKAYNAQMFTLTMDVFDKAYNFVGQLYITKTRHEFWTI